MPSQQDCATVADKGLVPTCLAFCTHTQHASHRPLPCSRGAGILISTPCYPVILPSLVPYCVPAGGIHDALRKTRLLATYPQPGLASADALSRRASPVRQASRLRLPFTLQCCHAAQPREKAACPTDDVVVDAYDDGLQLAHARIPSPAASSSRSGPLSEPVCPSDLQSSRLAC